MKKQFLMSALAVTFAVGVVTTSSIATAQSIQTAIPEKIGLSSKVPVSFYGFVLAEFIYSSTQLSSFGTLNNTAASYNSTINAFNRVQDRTGLSSTDAFISATPQNNRFGFLFSPYELGSKGFKIDADLEMDFNSNTNLSIATIVPRMRRAYVGIGQKRWHVLLGQEWELFSPLNTDTFNAGGNLWNQGNMGFRRPQIRFLFKQSIGEKNGVELGASANLPSNSLDMHDAANTTCVPMPQGRFGFWHDLPEGKLWAYISGVYYRNENPTAGASDINNWGFAASVLAPIHKFLKISAEFQYGYSLGTLLAISSNTARQRDVAGWGQIKSTWLDWFETTVGYGGDFLKGSQVAAGWVKNNQVAFVNLRFKPFKDFILGPEYNFLTTNYQGSGASRASTVSLNALYYF